MRMKISRVGFTNSLQGFTLIELVTVIVIIGVLAAVALPKFMDLRENAQIATFQGGVADARSKINLVHSAAIHMGPSSEKTINGCTSRLDAVGNGVVCLGDVPVFTAGFNMSCYSGMGQVSMFRGPYQANQNSIVYWHPNGDAAGGMSRWLHTDSGCQFDCTVGTGINSLTMISNISSKCQ
jgi:prepilin-type N-terminal cleavage/methylation domain-containing protein